MVTVFSSVLKEWEYHLFRRRCVELEASRPEFRMRQSPLENCRASTSIKNCSILNDRE